MRTLLVCLALAGCSAPAPAPKPVPFNASDAELCPAACKRRAELGCLEPQLADACLPVCERAAAAGLYSPTCVVGAYSRAELEGCRVRCGR